MKYKYTKSFTYLGKRYYVRGNTLEEVFTRKANKLRDLEQSVINYDSSTSVDVWADKAFETYKREDQLYDIKNRYKKYIKPYIGLKKISAVKAIECQAILNKCAGMSFSHCSKLKQELSFIFETATDNQLIPFNPAKKLKLPECTKGKRRRITDYEREHLYKVYDKDPQYLLFIIILKCGCRPEEAINLIGRDIDNNERLLHIRGTKTENSDRYVPIPDDLYEVIKKTGPFEPIVKNKAGRKHTKSSYIRICSRLKRDMNISMGCKLYRNALVPPYPLAEDFVPYCLRHTYCTDLCKAGVDVRTAQRLMGHANISVTADIYTHVDMDEIIKAGELIKQYQKAKSATAGAT